MKNKSGIIIGFFIGVIGFLLMFKMIFINRIAPEDELAPGAVVIASIVNGLLFAFVARFLERYYRKKG